MKKSSNETTTQRLSELIAEGESAKLEFKSTLRRDPNHRCIQTIAALLNSEGGRLLIGVGDDGKFSE